MIPMETATVEGSRLDLDAQTFAREEEPNGTHGPKGMTYMPLPVMHPEKEPGIFWCTRLWVLSNYVVGADGCPDWACR